MNNLTDYDFSLPKELIATEALLDRSESRLMCLLNGEENPRHDYFKNIGDYLRAGDTLVVNNTKVMKARITAFKETGGRAEILLVKPLEDKRWHALIKAKGKLDPGKKLYFTIGQNKNFVSIVEQYRSQAGAYIIECDDDLAAVAERVGELALPPYFQRRAHQGDNHSYQTVFAKELGAIAAPTAGLHFSAKLLAQLAEKDIDVAQVTLHVGPGTFLPIRCHNIEHHRMHSEFFRMNESCAKMLNQTKERKGRIIPVGSTSMRVVEQVMQYAQQRGQNNFFACSGETAIFIKPGYEFLASDAMITNFHLPRSTLILLIAALAGRQRILDAYREAIEHRYRFFSYGDACFFELQKTDLFSYSK